MQSSWQKEGMFQSNCQAYLKTLQYHSLCESSLNSLSNKHTVRCFCYLARRQRKQWKRSWNVSSQIVVCYLLSEVMVLVVGHAGGDVVDDLCSGGGVIRCSLACTAIPLETSHEATVSSEIHLREKHTCKHTHWGYIQNISFPSRPFLP